jgi:hypothetical protein
MLVGTPLFHKEITSVVRCATGLLVNGSCATLLVAHASNGTPLDHFHDPSACPSAPMNIFCPPAASIVARAAASSAAL